MILKFLKTVYLKSPKLNEVVLVLLSIFSYIFYKDKDLWSLAFAFLLALFLLEKPDYLIYSLLIFLSMILVDYIFKQDHMQSINGNYKVKKILSSGIVIKVDHNNILLRTRERFRLNDLVHVEGEVTAPKNFGEFDYISYLKTKHIINMVSFPHIKLLGVSNDIRSISREYLSNGPKEYKEIAPLILLGEKTQASKQFYNLSVKLSVVHLFVISGFHISLFYIICTKGLTYLKINKKISGGISLTIILIYLFLLNFPISATRAAMLTMLIFINKEYLKKRFSSLEVLSFVMGVFCIYHPWVIKSLSFIFTFIATGTILFFNTFDIESKWKKNTLIAISVYISTLFISININGYMSLFGIVFGVMLTPVFSFMFIVSIVFFPFKDYISYLYWAFEQLLFSLDSINILIDIPWMTKDISKVIYFILFSCFIIIKIWNLSTVKKTI